MGVFAAIYRIYIYLLTVHVTVSAPPIHKRASATVFLDVWVSVTVRVGALRGFGLVL